jgi:hypothetical protein
MNPEIPVSAGQTRTIAAAVSDGARASRMSFQARSSMGCLLCVGACLLPLHAASLWSGIPVACDSYKEPVDDLGSVRLAGTGDLYNADRKLVSVHGDLHKMVGAKSLAAV